MRARVPPPPPPPLRLLLFALLALALAAAALALALAARRRGRERFSVNEDGASLMRYRCAVPCADCPSGAYAFSSAAELSQTAPGVCVAKALQGDVESGLMSSLRDECRKDNAYLGGPSAVLADAQVRPVLGADACVLALAPGLSAAQYAAYEASLRRGDMLDTASYRSLHALWEAQERAIWGEGGYDAQVNELGRRVWGPDREDALEPDGRTARRYGLKSKREAEAARWDKNQKGYTACQAKYDRDVPPCKAARAKCQDTDLPGMRRANDTLRTQIQAEVDAAADLRRQRDTLYVTNAACAQGKAARAAEGRAAVRALYVRPAYLPQSECTAEADRARPLAGGGAGGGGAGAGAAAVIVTLGNVPADSPLFSMPGGAAGPELWFRDPAGAVLFKVTGTLAVQDSAPRPAGASHLRQLIDSTPTFPPAGSAWKDQEDRNFRNDPFPWQLREEQRPWIEVETSALAAVRRYAWTSRAPEVRGASDRAQSTVRLDAWDGGAWRTLHYYGGYIPPPYRQVLSEPDAHPMVYKRFRFVWLHGVGQIPVGPALEALWADFAVPGGSTAPALPGPPPPPPPPPPQPVGPVLLKAAEKSAPLCLQVDGDTDRWNSYGTSFFLGTCDGTNERQKFVYDPNQKLIRWNGAAQSLCYDDSGVAGNNGDRNAWLSWCDGANANQQFAYDEAARMFRSVQKANMCISDGGSVTPGITRNKSRIWACDGANTGQKFAFAPLAGFPPPPPQPAAAPPPPPPPRPPPAPYFKSGSKYGSGTWTVTERATLTNEKIGGSGHSWDDEMTDIALGPFTTVTFYTDPWYKGGQITWSNNTSSERRIGDLPNGTPRGDFYRSVSSYKMGNTPGPY